MQPKTLKRATFFTGISSNRISWLRPVPACHGFDSLTLGWAVSSTKGPHTISSLVSNQVSDLFFLPVLCLYISQPRPLTWMSSRHRWPHASRMCVGLPQAWSHHGVADWGGLVWNTAGRGIWDQKILPERVSHPKGPISGYGMYSHTQNSQSVLSCWSSSWPLASIDCLKFLKLCLSKKPEDRPTLAQLQLHQWLQ